MSQLNIYKIACGLAFICLAITVVMILNGRLPDAAPSFIGFFFLLSFGLRGFALLKGLSFTISILGVVTTALYFPHLFLKWNGFELALLITPLVQIIMFGMGSSMGVKDFIELSKSPKSVVVGVIAQYTIMPLLGYTLASLSHFPQEISAGIILLGCAPTSVTASLMCYLGKANVALAITITSVTTLIAPLLIPVLMSLFAGGFIEIDVLNMMWGMVKIVLLPIAVGLIVNKLLSGRSKWLADIMPLISMLGVALIVAIIMAAGRNSILSIGFSLFVVVFLMTVFGYFFGYWGARLFKMNERDSRTIAIATGMQNAGLVSGIAKVMGKIATVGLASAICGPIMGITASVLASYWSQKQPVERQKTTEPE